MALWLWYIRAPSELTLLVTILVIYLSSRAVDVATSLVDIIPKTENSVIIPPFPGVHISILQRSAMVQQNYCFSPGFEFHNILPTNSF